MNWDVFLHAFTAVYLIAIITFLVATYMGHLNDGFTRVLVTLLWPAYFAFWVIYYIAMMIAEVCIFFLENFWNEDFSDPGDDDEPDATT